MRPRTGAALTLAVALLATSCGGGGEPDATEPDATGSGTASPTGTSSSTAASESPGGLPSSEGELPASYPEEEVPLADGAIGEVLVNDAVGSYLVKVYPDTDFPTAFDQATTRLLDAGFTQGKDVISAGPTSSTADFTSDDWFVVVTGGMPERIVLQYTVYPQ